MLCPPRLSTAGFAPSLSNYHAHHTLTLMLTLTHTHTHKPMGVKGTLRCQAEQDK